MPPVILTYSWKYTYEVHIGECYFPLLRLGWNRRCSCTCCAGASSRHLASTTLHAILPALGIPSATAPVAVAPVAHAKRAGKLACCYYTLACNTAQEVAGKRAYSDVGDSRYASLAIWQKRHGTMGTMSSSTQHVVAWQLSSHPQDRC